MQKEWINVYVLKLTEITGKMANIIAGGTQTKALAHKRTRTWFGVHCECEQKQ